MCKERIMDEYCSPYPFLRWYNRFMRYDPDNRKYYFNKEMILSEQGKRELSECYDQYGMEMMASPFETMNDAMKRAPGSHGEKILSVLIGVSLFIGIVATAICLSAKQFDAAYWIMIFLFFIFGIIFAVRPFFGVSDSFSESVIMVRIEGVVSLLTAAGVFLAGRMVTDHSSVRFIMTAVIAAMIGLFIIMLIKTIGYIFVRQTVYRQTVDATCIGYIRTYESASNESLTPVYAPVYDYSYEGVRYQAFPDIMDRGTDGTVQVGSSCKIGIDPNRPACVNCNAKRYVVTMSVFALMFLAAAIILFVLLP